jgi:U5 small nuclear ribonucleoprotein component
MDMLVEQTHDLPPLKPGRGPRRFTDTRLDEQARGISIKMAPMSLVLESGSGKSYLFNLMDCPGHADFDDEVAAAMRLADGVLLVVDALEGVLAVTRRAIRQAVGEGLAVTLLISKVRGGGGLAAVFAERGVCACSYLSCLQPRSLLFKPETNQTKPNQTKQNLNQIDRLVLELKLPPADAYYKLKHTVEEANRALYEAAGVAAGTPEADALCLDPLKGNVAFASAAYGFSFTLDSFAGAAPRGSRGAPVVSAFCLVVFFTRPCLAPSSQPLTAPSPVHYNNKKTRPLRRRVRRGRRPRRPRAL